MDSWLGISPPFIYYWLGPITLTLFCHWAACRSFSQWLFQQLPGSQSAQSHTPLSHSHHKPPWRKDIGEHRQWVFKIKNPTSCIPNNKLKIQHTFQSTLLPFIFFGRGGGGDMLNNRAYGSNTQPEASLSALPCTIGCFRKLRRCRRGPCCQ